MKTTTLLIACLLATAPVLAQDKPADTNAATSANKLDLNLPKSTLYRNDPPGTWYGDTSGVPASASSTPANGANRTTATTRDGQCEGQLHGSVAMGMGFSNRGGNSNWQALNLRSCKTFYNDDGRASQVGISINVGQFNGPNGFGSFGPRSAPMTFDSRR
jgi:hypothetical protein